MLTNQLSSVTFFHNMH